MAGPGTERLIVEDSQQGMTIGLLEVGLDHSSYEAFERRWSEGSGLVSGSKLNNSPEDDLVWMYT